MPEGHGGLKEPQCVCECARVHGSQACVPAGVFMLVHYNFFKTCGYKEA